MNPGKPPKIITVTHEYYPKKGGIAIFIMELARCACALGYDIEVWAPEHSELENATFPYKVRQMPLKGRQGLPSRYRLARFMHKHRHLWKDAILYFPEPGPIRTWMYLQLLRFPMPQKLVITLHGSEMERLSFPPHRSWLLQKLLEKADLISVLSHYNRRVLLEKYPSLAHKVSITHGALRADVVPDTPAGKRKTVDTIAETPSHSKGKPLILLTVARIHPRKGQHCVVETLTRLPRDILSKIEYWIVGETVRRSYYNRIMAMAAKYDLPVYYKGAVDHARLADYYRQADLFAMTSVFTGKSVEGFGLTYLEAAAFGLPVIAHRTGGVEDAIKEGETGFILEQNDREGMAKAITQLVEDQTLRNRMGRAGQEWVKHFSWEYVVERLFGVWQEKG